MFAALSAAIQAKLSRTVSAAIQAKISTALSTPLQAKISRAASAASIDCSRVLMVRDASHCAWQMQASPA